MKPERKELEKEFWVSIQKFKEESRLFHRIRKALPPRGSRNAEHMVIYETARLRYGRAAKERQDAEHKFRSAVQPNAVSVDARVRSLLNEIQDAIRGIPSDTAIAKQELEEEEKQHKKHDKDPKTQALLREMLLKKDLERSRQSVVPGFEDDPFRPLEPAAKIEDSSEELPEDLEDLNEPL